MSARASTPLHTIDTATATGRDGRRLRRVLAGATAVVALGVSAVLAVGPATAGDDGDGLLVRSGVEGSTPLPTGGVAIFGVNPGGAPWVADDDSRITVGRDGGLVAKVRGLVIPGRVPPNPVRFLSASLSCNGAPGALTTPVAFSEAGDATIRATVAVPARCVAPVVLLHPANIPAGGTTPVAVPGVYIGATG
ncbi:MAG: hypothetical protein ACKVZ6_00040 [Kineosporiaceae bacterium]|jgi:hypothetical protein